MSSAFEAIVWKDNKIVLLDQTLIPISETYISYDELAPFIDAIQRLVVRGAPALGVAGAYGVVLAIDEAARKGLTAKDLENSIDSLRDARPTAVNLAWAVEKIRKHLPEGRDAVLAAAHQLAREDKQSSTDMGNIGADWLINKLGYSNESSHSCRWVRYSHIRGNQHQAQANDRNWWASHSVAHLEGLFCSRCQ